MIPINDDVCMPGGGTGRSAARSISPAAWLRFCAVAITLSAFGAATDAATFRCLVRLPPAQVTTDSHREVFVESTRADMARLQAIKEICSQGCAGGVDAICKESADTPPAPSTSPPASRPMPDTAGLGLPSPAPGNFICQPDGAPLGAQEHFIDASTLDELERKARQQIGAAFRSAEASCMTVAQRRALGKQLAAQRLVQQSEAAAQAATPGTAQACHAARSACAAHCAAQLLGAQRADASACVDTCAQTTQRCLQQAR